VRGADKEKKGGEKKGGGAGCLSNAKNLVCSESHLRREEQVKEKAGYHRC